MEDRIMLDLDALMEELTRVRRLSAELDDQAYELRRINNEIFDIGDIGQKMSEQLAVHMSELLEVADDAARLVANTRQALDMFAECEGRIQRRLSTQLSPLPLHSDHWQND